MRPRVQSMFVLATLAVMPVATTSSEVPSGGNGLTLEQVIDRPLESFPAACAGTEPAVRSSTPVGDQRSHSTDRPPSDGPTPVDVYLYLLAIDDIDPQRDSFRFEGYAGLIWCDRRLAADAPRRGAGPRRFWMDSAVAELERIWAPAVFLPTRIGESSRSSELLEIHPNGTVRFTMKFNTRLAADFDYREFPIDRQRLVLPVQSLVYRDDEVDLRPAPGMSGFDPEFKLPEWSIVSSRTTEADRTARGSSRGFARFQSEVVIARRWGFYVWKVAIPIVIIMMVSWSVFWMTRDALAQRQRQSATAVLTIVAFQFVVAGFLPRVPYLTLMDTILLWSFVATASTLFLNVRNVRAFREDPEGGLRKDRMWRWLYPTVYVAGIVLVLGRNFLFRVAVE